MMLERYALALALTLATGGAAGLMPLALGPAPDRDAIAFSPGGCVTDIECETLHGIPLELSRDAEWLPWLDETEVRPIRFEEDRAAFERFLRSRPRPPGPPGIPQDAFDAAMEGVIQQVVRENFPPPPPVRTTGPLRRT